MMRDFTHKPGSNVTVKTLVWCTVLEFYISLYSIYIFSYILYINVHIMYIYIFGAFYCFLQAILCVLFLYHFSSFCPLKSLRLIIVFFCRVLCLRNQIFTPLLSSDKFRCFLSHVFFFYLFLPSLFPLQPVDAFSLIVVYRIEYVTTQYRLKRAARRRYHPVYYIT
jgi:hypothetical protein